MHSEMKVSDLIPISMLSVLLLPSFVIFPAYSQTYDEWFAIGWDAGCEDSASGSTNQTEGKNTPFIKGYNLGFAECSTGNTVNNTAVTNMTGDTAVFLDDRLQETNDSTTQTTPELAYDIGCGDVGLYEYEKYINQPGNESSSQTEEFMDEYYRGYSECGGDVSPAEKGFEPGTPSQFYQPQPSESLDTSRFSGPLYTPQQRIVPPEPLYTPQPPQQPTLGGIDWIAVCNNLQVALISSCDVLVNSDTTLTSEGQRAVDCIRNGILLAGGGTFLANLPLPLVITALKALEEPTSCGGIVNWGLIGNVGDLQGIISLLT